MPEPPASPEAPDGGFEAPEAPSLIGPRGWFGFGFRCGDCSAKSGAAESAAVWRFGTLPIVYSVDLGSPAARAGLRRGDVITHIDGVSILTPEGGRRFGAILPGQSVRWTVMRDRSRRDVVARAAEGPERREHVALVDLRRELSRLDDVSDLQQLRRELASLNQRIERIRVESAAGSQEAGPRRIRIMELPLRRLRYAGVIGGTEVEVRGPGSVVVSESEARDELIINTGEAVVVLRVPGELPERPGGRRK